MCFNLLLGLCVVVAVMNAMVMLAAWAVGQRPKAFKHFLFMLGMVGCAIVMVVVRDVATWGPAQGGQPATAPIVSASATASSPTNGLGQAPVGPGAEEVVGSLLDTLWYLLATLSPVVSILAGILFFFVRRRAIRSGRAPVEKWAYLTCIVGGMVVWLWSGLHPTPAIFEDRAGLYWGVDLENVTWHIQSRYSTPAATIFKGTSSARIHFGKTEGRIVFHHFPMGVSFDRYSAIEFAIHKGDLQSRPLYICLCGDKEKPYPSKPGLVIGASGETTSRPDSQWIEVRMPLGEFQFDERRIMGICIGKDQTDCEGDFYLDCIRLVEK